MRAVPDFDRLYAEDPDPWRVATSWYERRKIAVTLAALRRERYDLAWDAAAGTGDLAAALADRCATVLATDASARACALTQARVAGLGPARVERSALPDRPAGLADGPDLVVLSEVLYYLTDRQRRATYDLLTALAHDETEVVAVHWLGALDDAYVSGATAQRELDARLVADGWSRLVTHTDEEFGLALWSPTAAGPLDP